MPNESEFTSALLKALGDLLFARMPLIQFRDAQIREEWPESNEAFSEYPTIALISEPGLFTPHMSPSVSSSVVNVDDAAQYDYKYAVGQFDFEIKADIWTDYKIARHEAFQQFFAALQGDMDREEFTHHGVTLTLDDYHSVQCHLFMSDYQYGDSEEASQRKEWRVRISLTGNCEAIYEVTKPAMVDLDVDAEIGASAEVGE